MRHRYCWSCLSLWESEFRIESSELRGRWQIQLRVSSFMLRLFFGGCRLVAPEGPRRALSERIDDETHSCSRVISYNHFCIHAWLDISFVHFAHLELLSSLHLDHQFRSCSSTMSSAVICAHSPGSIGEEGEDRVTTRSRGRSRQTTGECSTLPFSFCCCTISCTFAIIKLNALR